MLKSIKLLGKHKINLWIFSKILKNPSLSSFFFFFFSILNPLIFHEFETGHSVSIPSIFLSSISVTLAFSPPHFKILFYFFKKKKKERKREFESAATRRGWLAEVASTTFEVARGH
jgi:hypothetical protein